MSDPRGFSLYARLPVSLQNLACTVVGLKIRKERYNKTFYRALRFLQSSERWSDAALRAYQDEQLSALAEHAYRTVPYYREVFDSRRLAPGDIRRVEDLEKLPVLDKQTVRSRTGDLLSRGWPQRRRIYGHTGGTTGTALPLWSDVDTQPWQWAVWWRHRLRFGLGIHDPFIAFAGRSVVPLSSMRPPIWRRNLSMHQTYVSVHHMTRQNLPTLVDYLQRREVVYYSGYPSALYLLALHLLESGIRLRHPPRITSLGAETVLPHQRSAIERALDTRVIDQYGASEQCGNISECELHRYHVDHEFGIVEFLPIPGRPPNERRIICTGLRNPVMPLIRYDIGDVATLGDNSCACGRAGPVVERIDGRIESYVVTPDGRQLGRLDFLFKESHRVAEAQLVQESGDRLVIKVVREPGYSERDERQLLDDAAHYLGDEIQIEVVHMDSIPREPNGKFRQIVSRVFVDPLRDSRGTTAGGS